MGLSSCGSDESDGGSTPDSSSSSSAEQHNDADVAFATDMIQHHAQALAMTDLVAGRSVSEEFTQLVDDIRAAQAPEIELMSDWLQEWGEPVPETVRDHANAGHSGHSGDSGHSGEAPEGEEMPGMMSADDMAELEDAPDAAFEELWLEMMIAHHEGAVAMAETELDEGSAQAALDLAEQIRSSQTDEIAHMQEMLDG